MNLRLSIKAFWLKPFVSCFYSCMFGFSMRHAVQFLLQADAHELAKSVDATPLEKIGGSLKLLLGIRGWPIKLSSRSQIGCAYAQLPFKCEEIALHVLSFISAETLAKVRSASHQWMKWASTRQLWKSLACLHWPGLNVLENGGLAGGNFMAYFLKPCT